VLVAVNEEATRPTSESVAAALRARGISTEVAPKADKFGKQIRYADRRGIPFVWFLDDAGGSVKDIRSGEQVAADPATWSPPEDDLRPQVRLTPTEETHL
jgi:histidyl-tRNA synthetase